MKKLIVIFALVLFSIANAQQGVFQTFDVLNPEGTSTFYVAGTASDTSAEFATGPIMSLYAWAGDTVPAGDSTLVSVKLQLNADTLLSNIPSMWYTWATYTPNLTDSTARWYLITNQAVPPAKRARYIVTGVTNNRVLFPVAVKLVHVNWVETRRN